MKTRVRSLFILLAGVLCVCAAFAGGKKEAGIPRIVIATAEGPMTWTVENYKQEFEEANNCEIELITFPFGEYYQKMMTSFTLGSGAYDMVLFPVGYVGDFAGGGYLLSLDETKGVR